MRDFARALQYDTVRGLASWRWLAVPVVFAAACWNEISSLRLDSGARAPLNVWDGPLSMLQNTTLVVFLALGFLLVVGDGYARDRARGTVALTIIRTRSRTTWWLAMVGSIGVLALVFSALGLFASLLVSAVRLPLELDASPAAHVAWGAEGSLYPRFAGMPMPLFFGFVVLYTAAGLWALGGIILAVSVLEPQPYVPIAAAILWVLLELLALPSLVSRGGDSIDPFFHLFFAAHFGERELALADPVSWEWSALVICVSLAGACAAGALKLRWSDV